MYIAPVDNGDDGLDEPDNNENPESSSDNNQQGSSSDKKEEKEDTKNQKQENKDQKEETEDQKQETKNRQEENKDKKEEVKAEHKEIKNKEYSIMVAGSIPESVDLKVEKKGEKDEDGVRSVSFDISLEEDGAEWQPHEGETVTVSVPASLLDLADGDYFIVYHTHESKTDTIGPNVVENGLMSFTTESFSPFELEPYGKDKPSAGTFDHIELEVHASVNVVIAGVARNLPVTLAVEDINISTTTITSSSNGSFEVDWDDVTGASSTSDTTVRIGGKYQYGTADNPVEYTITVKKTITETIDGIEYTIPVTLSVTTNYWAEDNHCEGVTGDNNQRWKEGEYVGGGIDVPIGGTSNYVDQGDLSISKYINGVSAIDEPVSFSFDIYKKVDEGYELVTTTNPLVISDITTIPTCTNKLDVGEYYIVESDESPIDGFVHLYTTYNLTTYNGDTPTTSLIAPETITINGEEYSAAKVTVINQTTIYISVTNNYVLDTSIRPDSNYILVKKTFSGISEDDIPEDFSITVQGNETTYVLTDSSEGGIEFSKSTDGLTWEWKIPNASVGQYTVSENCVNVDNYTLTVTPEGIDTVGCTVEVKAEAITLENTEIRNSCSNQDFVVANGQFFAATLNKEKMTVVITQYPLNTTVKASLKSYFEGQNGGWKTDNGVIFYSIDQCRSQGLDSIIIESTVITLKDNNIIHIDEKSNWTHAMNAIFDYQMQLNGDISITNSYELKTTFITLDKVVEGNMGDWNKYFTFTIYLNDSTEAFSTVTMNHNTPEVKIENIPIGDKVVIVETNNEGYEVSANVDSNGVEVTTNIDHDTNCQSSKIVIDSVDKNGHAIQFINTNNANIETGLSTDSAPYFVLFIVAFIGAGVVLLNKRRYTGKF
ncbi:MAG: hypothetical protein ACI4TD_02850 [Phocaeicola sp.]